MLELSLSFNQDTYRPNEPVEGKFTLRNTGPEPALVNARLGINSPYAPDEFRELALDITGPAGQPLDFMARVNVGNPEDQDFKVLQAGASVEHTYTINYFFELVEPGAYQVRATYQNQSEPSQANGHQAWKGEVQSNPATLTIQG